MIIYIYSDCIHIYEVYIYISRIEKASLNRVANALIDVAIHCNGILLLDIIYIFIYLFILLWFDLIYLFIIDLFFFDVILFFYLFLLYSSSPNWKRYYLFLFLIIFILLFIYFFLIDELKTQELIFEQFEIIKIIFYSLSVRNIFGILLN